MSTNGAPEVGMGATYKIGGDCHPVTVTEVSACGRMCGVAFDQVYSPHIFVPREQTERVFLLGDDGVWRRGDIRFGTLSLGRREFARERMNNLWS